MANENGHGGYRRPSSPAPVSGPGNLSRRTDGRQPVRALPEAGYGENKEFEQLQQGAPLQQANSASQVASPPQVDMSSIVGLGEPSRSRDPVTTGVDLGAGPMADSNPLGGDAEVEELRHRYAQWMPVLVRKADSPLSSPEFKAQVRYLLSIM